MKRSIPRSRWALMALIALVLYIGIAGLFVVPVHEGESESLLKHLDKIPAMHSRAILRALDDLSSFFLLLLLGLPLISLPGFVLYCIYRSSSSHNKLKAKKNWIIAVGGYLTIWGGLTIWGTIYNPLPTNCFVSGNPFENIDNKSTDLEADIQMMWQTQDPEPERAWVTATSEAVWAANRVFNTLELKGMTLDEAKQTLRVDLRAPNYGYIAPFWPVEENSYPLRFDNGAWGWQFDIVTNAEDKVIDVKRSWIH